MFVDLLVVMTIFMEYGNNNVDANFSVSFILISGVGSKWGGGGVCKANH